jgi:excisionase family DNA binding protein
MAPDWDDEFLTVNEIAEHLRLTQQTVRNWIDQGSLPAIRVGRRVRVRRIDFDRLVSAGATLADSPEPAPAVSGDPRDQFAGAVQSARDVLGRLSAARRSELAVALQNLRPSRRRTPARSGDPRPHTDRRRRSSRLVAVIAERSRARHGIGVDYQ